MFENKHRNRFNIDKQTSKNLLSSFKKPNSTERSSSTSNLSHNSKSILIKSEFHDKTYNLSSSGLNFEIQFPFLKKENKFKNRDFSMPSRFDGAYQRKTSKDKFKLDLGNSKIASAKKKDMDSLLSSELENTRAIDKKSDEKLTNKFDQIKIGDSKKSFKIFNQILDEKILNDKQTKLSDNLEQEFKSNEIYTATRRNATVNDDNTVIVTNSRNRAKHELSTTYGFNEDTIGLFEETFQIFDIDRDGSITLNEIKRIMNSLGFYPADDVIRTGIKDIDKDNSGTVDLEEFVSMMSKSRCEIDQELKEIFEIFDKNQDGFIDKFELRDVLTRLGENITDDEAFEMIREADVNGDNKVSFSEFRSILRFDNKAANNLLST